MNKQILKDLPKVDILVQSISNTCSAEAPGKRLLKRAVQDTLDRIRQRILAGIIEELPTTEDIISEVLAECRRIRKHSLHSVVNSTGVALHTNLGRSIISHEAACAVMDAAEHYSTLEYNLAEGKRGSRQVHVEGLLKELCGCEAAMVVNNNAAAVLIMLSALAKGKEVVVSRGELIEIGGSFRIPEICELGGSILKEVGTTNKTHLYDYEKAVDEDTGAFLKVHTSNFRFQGFTEEAGLKELVDSGHKAGLPVLYDCGSGALISLKDLKASEPVSEPNAREAMQLGVDVACFSGDKLLGGPQAGILIGKKEYIDQMKKHPLARVVRVDKMTIAALEATLKHYQAGEEWEQIPVLKTLKTSEHELEARYEALAEEIGEHPDITMNRYIDETPAGGGALPGIGFRTICMELSVSGYTADKLEKHFRSCEIPVIGRIKDGRYLLDTRTLLPEDFRIIATNLKNLTE